MKSSVLSVVSPPMTIYWLVTEPDDYKEVTVETKSVKTVLQLDCTGQGIRFRGQASSGWLWRGNGWQAASTTGGVVGAGQLSWPNVTKRSSSQRRSYIKHKRTKRISDGYKYAPSSQRRRGQDGELGDSGYLYILLSHVQSQPWVMRERYGKKRNTVERRRGKRTKEV